MQENLLDTSLTSYLHNGARDNAQQAVPFHIQTGLSHDVAQALTFLHQKGIIHQNLTDIVHPLQACILHYYMEIRQFLPHL